MPDAIISDTSCLIILNKIGELDLLHKLYKTVTITLEIATEFGEVLPDWIEIKHVENKSKQQWLETHIDKGEASAIALALETRNSIIILDDWKARRVAEDFEIPVTGSIGIIIKAKNSGLLESIKPCLDKIKETDFRMSDELINTALTTANEK